MNTSSASAPADLQAARGALPALAAAGTDTRAGVLERFAELLTQERERILAVNAEEASRAAQASLSAPLRDRLSLAGGNYAAMVDSVRAVAELPDPLGFESAERACGSIFVRRMRVPLGLICFIYESRPNVTADGAALCIKSGNGVILRGGSEAMRTSAAIGDCARRALQDAQLSADAVQVISDPDRNKMTELLSDARIDLVIPRGGSQLVAHVQATAQAPVLAHLYGNCHLYVHQSADFEQAINIIANAKVQRPGTCNALESLVVDEPIAEDFLPKLAVRLAAEQVQLVGCPTTCAILPSGCAPADAKDWQAEYLELRLSIKVVAGLAAAVAWINQHGSQHTDGILATDADAARQFVQAVDSSSVLVNTSTRFADGYMYGLGAETGISTGKFHARGPVGLEGLTSYKWVVRSDGAVRG